MSILLNFNDLSKQSKIGYNALYNVIFSHSTSFNAKNGLNKFTVPLCLNENNKVALTERNFIFFESILSELKLHGYYSIVSHNGRAVEETKTDYSTVEIVLSKNALDIPSDIKVFDFSEVDTSKLLKRDGKAEKAKTEENKAKTEEEKKTVEETSKALEEKTEEVEKLKKEVAKKEEQLNKKAIAEFNDKAYASIIDSIEFLIKKHCKMVPDNFDFASLECDLMTLIDSQWNIESIKK